MFHGSLPMCRTILELSFVHPQIDPNICTALNGQMVHGESIILRVAFT